MENDELAKHLESLQRENCYRVDAVLKESPVEVTQRVFFGGSNGAETGPYIRKFIKRGFGVGGAYERIFASQQHGRRFKHIPDVLECYTRDDELVVVMELVHGQTLQEAVYERDPSVQLAREIFPKLCDAVCELHREFDPPIIHRDLKPSNVILTGEGLALIDFGISREYREDAEVDTTRFGTREFAPPEQYGFGQTGIYSDVYSLGMVLYFCLTEKIPNAQARNQAFRDPAIPESLRLVINRAVALDPAMRFANAEELKGAFLEAVGKLECAKRFPAENITPAEGEGSHRSKRNAAPVAIIAIAACLVLAVVFFGGIRAGSTSQSPNSSSGSASAKAAVEANSTESAPSNDGAVNAESGKSPSGEASSSASDGKYATSEQLVFALDLGNQANPKNGFDPETNHAVEVAGVEFQIPRYFSSKTSTGDGGESFYYAETGSSVAMIMTMETFISDVAGRAEFEDAKDEYVSGMMESSIFDEVTASTDCELAGLPARVVSLSGSVEDVPASFKGAFFFNPDTHIVGAIMFGQTANTQYDYSLDFAKVITSAKKA